LVQLNAPLARIICVGFVGVGIRNNFLDLLIEWRSLREIVGDLYANSAARLTEFDRTGFFVPTLG
jgi:hypothetical protein